MVGPLHNAQDGKPCSQYILTKMSKKHKTYKKTSLSDIVFDVSPVNSISKMWFVTIFLSIVWYLVVYTQSLILNYLRWWLL